MIKRKHFLVKDKEIKIKYSFFLFLSVFFLFLIDILSKYYFSNKFYLQNTFLYIKSTTNTGSAFSMFSNISYYNLIIAILGVIFILILIYYKFYKNEFENNTLTLIWILIVSGILGNTYDRFFFGYTRDFIGFGNLFIFNIADFYLTLSIIIYLISEFKLFTKNI